MNIRYRLYQQDGTQQFWSVNKVERMNRYETLPWLNDSTFPYSVYLPGEIKYSLICTQIWWQAQSIDGDHPSPSTDYAAMADVEDWHGKAPGKTLKGWEESCAILWPYVRSPSLILRYLGLQQSKILILPKCSTFSCLQKSFGVLHTSEIS